MDLTIETIQKVFKDNLNPCYFDVVVKDGALHVNPCRAKNSIVFQYDLVNVLRIFDSLSSLYLGLIHIFFDIDNYRFVVYL